MPRNNRTSGVGTPKALDNVCFPADNSRDTAPALILQANWLRRRLGVSVEQALMLAPKVFECGRPRA